MFVQALLCLLAGALAVDAAGNVLCYYDGKSYIREDRTKLIVNDLNAVLPHCTHLIYGYAGIDKLTNKLVSLNEKLDLDVGTGLFRKVTSLKAKYPKLKVLLSVGADRDLQEEDNNKYHVLLENKAARDPFINSAHTLVQSYQFDGLDIAWQFNKNKPKHKHGLFGSAWKSFKQTLGPKHVVDDEAESHKEGFVSLIRELSVAFRPDKLEIGLSVLPNVNSSLFYDIPALQNYVSYVNLHAYDFQTPTRNLKEADYPAPIYALNERHPEANVDAQVHHWLSNGFPATKLNVAVPTYGLAWTLTKDSGLTGVPPVPKADGPATINTHDTERTDGLLSWPQICARLKNPANQHLKGADAPLRQVNDPAGRYGSYAYRTNDDDGNGGIWIGYEGPEAIARKAEYIKKKGLGGIAIVDLSFDDHYGACSGNKFPLVEAAIRHL